MLRKERKKDSNIHLNTSFIERESLRLQEKLKDLVHENLLLKTGLSARIKTNFESNKLNDFENLNNRLIVNDESIFLLSREWFDLKELIEKNLTKDGIIENIIENKLRKLIQKAEEIQTLIMKTKMDLKA